MINVNILWHVGKGFWDEGLTERLLTGAILPLPFHTTEYLMTIPESSDDGCIVVLPGRWIDNQDEKIIEQNEKLFEYLETVPYYLVLHVGDEETCFNSSFLKKDNSKVWVQTPNLNKKPVADRYMFLGWQIDTIEILDKIGRKPLSERRLWYFAGQNTHPIRNECVGFLYSRLLNHKDDGLLMPTEGFTQGLPREEYLKELTNSKIAICPAGPQTPDTFRLYEAIEAGCLPICNRYSPNWSTSFDYWQFVLGEQPPFPTIKSWDEAQFILNHYKENPEELELHILKVQKWWSDYKEKLAVKLILDITDLYKESNEKHNSNNSDESDSSAS